MTSKSHLSIWELGQADENHDCRALLKSAQTYLKDQFFNNSAAIDWLVHQQASFVDEVLQYLWDKYLESDTPVTLIAVGGYGRGELHPHSDVDLLILLDESISDAPPAGLSDFVTALWDSGLDIGHSVRTVAECRQLAEDDITIATNLLEARYLCGHRPLFDDLEELTVSNKTWDTRLFFERKRQEQIARHEKYNDTANNLEPNLKESPGGLRDIQVINWVAQQHFDVSDLYGLNKKDFLAQNEYEILRKSQRFLWRVRFVLHHLAGRKQEKLLIDHQRELSKLLGYRETDKRMAVEHFMKDYYRCARAVTQMNALLLQIFEENIIQADEPQAIQPINRRFQSHNGYLETINPGIFAFYPYAMLEVFLLLQQNPHLKGIRASTIRQMHAHMHLIDKRFRADIKNRSLFMEIIRQPKGVSHEFRRMNQLGVLGAYLPGFGQIVGQMQHDMFHAYTVDEHTLFLVSNLQRFSCPEFSDEFPLCSEVFMELPKPELLYIAGIFHDIAKGRGGDHSVLGVVDAENFCKQHSISEYDTETVCFLVRQHLAMSAVAQRSDIEDPDVIRDFSKLVQTVDRLNYLYLLTVADIRATNENLWNGWRDSLLKQLYYSTRQWLEDSEQQAKNTREKSFEKYDEAMQMLMDRGWPESRITELWQHYSLDYFLRHSIEQILWQTTLRLEQPTQTTLVALRPYHEENTLELYIFSRDRRGLFAAMTATLEKLQLNILDAKINTTTDGQALNTFIVEGTHQRHPEIIEALEAQLAEEDLSQSYQPQMTSRINKLFKTPPTLRFEENNQQYHTVMELYTHDRPGLLSTVAQVFLAQHVQLINAKLVTLGDQVEDVFFITTEDDKALSDEARLRLQTTLQDALTQQAEQQASSMAI